MDEILHDEPDLLEELKTTFLEPMVAPARSAETMTLKDVLMQKRQ